MPQAARKAISIGRVVRELHGSRALWLILTPSACQRLRLAKPAKAFLIVDQPASRDVDAVDKA